MKKTVLLLCCSIAMSYYGTAQITDPAPYCENSYDDWFEGDGIIDIGYIDGVTLESIENLSSGGAGQSEYKYYDEMSTDLTVGETYEITIVANNWGHVAAAWIDFNGDGDFEDDSERLGFESLLEVGEFPKTITINFTVPEGSVAGETRMRVRNAEWDFGDIFSDTGDGPDACATYNSGETEDYNINIVGGEGEGDASIGSNEKLNFEVYPNPTNDHIQIIGVDINNVQYCRVYNANGTLSMEVQSNLCKVDVTGLKTGVYIVELVFDSGEIRHQKIVKS